jgi:oxalate decarboxylase/phosphoglucose isomerase-like protein (cupin superfamily)
MTDGLILPPGAGQGISAAGMTLKVGAGQSPTWSLFEATVQPGFDVGAHLHQQAEELFYVLEGELDLLAFEPRVRTADGWTSWESRTGDRVARGGPGSTMYVPAGCPHAFTNPGPSMVRMIFVVTPPGHEDYLRELGELIARPGPPDQNEISALRARHDIQQLTALNPGRAR